MANNSCGCNGSTTNPPGTTLPSINAPAGSQSTYAGTAMIPRGRCGPAACPAPPVSDAPESTPYCPGWIQRLTASAWGKLMVIKDNCLYLLKSKCSGYVFYNADTEQTEVVNPPYVSAIPKETSYGFLAKVVPTPTTVCIDGQDACTEEVRQELASQVLGEAACGEMILANFPLCSDLPASQAADADKQVRLDYAELPDQDTIGCPEQIIFPAFYVGRRGTGRNAVDCKYWFANRYFKMRGSQWNFIPAGAPEQSTAKQVVVVPVPGGTPNDPCFQLRVLESGSGGLPSEAAECDTIQRRFVGTPEEGWYAVPIGGRRFWLDTPMNLTAPTTGGGGITTGLTDYALYRDMGCSLRAIVKILQVIQLSGSGAGGSASITANGITAAANYVPSAGSILMFAAQVSIPLTEDKITLVRINSFSGSSAISTTDCDLVGYEVGS